MAWFDRPYGISEIESSIIPIFLRKNGVKIRYFENCKKRPGENPRDLGGGRLAYRAAPGFAG